jgi:hypothetical protein
MFLREEVTDTPMANPMNLAQKKANVYDGFTYTPDNIMDNGGKPKSQDKISLVTIKERDSIVNEFD